MRRLVFPTAAVVLLAACSNMSSVSPTQPSAAAASQSLAVREGASAAKNQQLTVSPSVMVFGAAAGSQTFVATTKGAGEIIASATPGCLVDPGLAQAVNDPGNGHSVTFTVSVPAAPAFNCTVTVTDKKGNTATVEVRREYSGGDII